jgi:ABC-type oligopeptide transport system substrate-binding subunit
MPVTAADFEFAWRRALHPATGSQNDALPYDILLLDIKGAQAFYTGQVTDPAQVGIHARDALTLEVELEEPTPYFLHLLAQSPPVPRHVVTTHGAAWAEAQHIVTNGPFRLENWQPGHSMVFVRNPTYHGRFSGNVQRVERHFVSDWTTRLALYAANELDVIGMGDQTPLEIDRVRQRHASDYRAIPWLLCASVGLDVSHPPFDDMRVRQALALAINRQTLANVALRGYVAPATGGVLPPGMPGHSSDISLPYDPERARQLLAEAGYPGGRGFPAVDVLLTADVAGELTVRFLATQWREILRVEVQWKIMKFVELQSWLSSRQPPPFFFQRNLADYPDPDTYLRFYQYLFGRQLDHYSRLVGQIRRTSDLGERLKLCQQADRLLVEEAVMIPLWYERLHRLVKPWVHKYSISALGSSFWKDVVIEAH